MLVDLVYVFRFKGRKPLGTNIKIFLWVIFLLSMLYNDSFRFFYYCFIIFAISYYSSYLPEKVPEREDETAQKPIEIATQ